MQTTLAELISADLDNTGALLEIMEAERQKLEKQELDNLGQLILDKAKLLATIEEHDELRRSLLAKIELPATKEGYLSYIQQLGEPASSDCLRQFELLQGNLIKCKEVNTLNGIITNRSRRRNAQKLNVLKGKPQVSGLYDSRGCANSHSSSNSISEA